MLIAIKSSDDAGMQIWYGNKHILAEPCDGAMLNGTVCTRSGAFPRSEVVGLNFSVSRQISGQQAAHRTPKMDMDRHAPGNCIYCGQPGPFSDEHVICAGLGADDPRWLLQGCVCSCCNTRVFSKLETKLLRSSPIAVARLFAQPLSRRRSGKTNAPTVQPRVSYFTEPGTGLQLEADLVSGGALTVLPQVLMLLPDQAAVRARDFASAEAFVTLLQNALGDAVNLIRKQHDGFEVIFCVTPLHWEDGMYVIGEATIERRPLEKGVWIEPLTLPSTAVKTDLLPPRIFQRHSGQLVCRIDGIDLAASLMSVLRVNPICLTPPAFPGTSAGELQPVVQQRYAFNRRSFERVLTKIGLNLIAHLLGIGLIRDSAFDAAVAFARFDTGSVCKYSIDRVADVAGALGRPLIDRHLFMLVRAPAQNGSSAIICVIQLYNTAAEFIKLAEMPNTVDVLERPIVILVDYMENVIKTLTLEEHMEACVN